MSPHFTDRNRTQPCVSILPPFIVSRCIGWWEVGIVAVLFTRDILQPESKRAVQARPSTKSCSSRASSRGQQLTPVAAPPRHFPKPQESLVRLHLAQDMSGQCGQARHAGSIEPGSPSFGEQPVHIYCNVIAAVAVGENFQDCFEQASCDLLLLLLNKSTQLMCSDLTLRT